MTEYRSLPGRVLRLFQAAWLCQDNQGMAMVIVLSVMAALFAIGTASLTNSATENKISQNYQKSVRAFYDCEAGIAEGMAKIKSGTAVIEQDGDPNWISTTQSYLFKYRYHTTYDAANRTYTITSEGKDPSQTANRRIVAEMKRIFSAGDIRSPVYCGSGETKGNANSIRGDSVSPAWASDGDSSNEGSVPCVTTPNPYVSATNPLKVDQTQLFTADPNKVDYDVDPIDLVAMANFYKDLPPDMTSIPTGTTVTIGSETDTKVVYINGNQTIAGDKYGYGILVVTGDLHISGQLHWNGIVIVLGNNLIQTGGGVSGLQVTGAVLTPNHFEIRGNADIQWSADVVKKVINNAGDPLKVVSWKEE
ncbi:MAG: pilus assembly PilX N-terminal domain-containing protein [bacterium]